MPVRLTVTNHWGELADALPAKCQMITDATAQYVYDYSQALVPVLSGYLKSTGEIIAGSNQFDKIVQYTADYAEYVEYGTRFMAAEPYITPAIEKAAEYMEQMLAALFTGIAGV